MLSSSSTLLALETLCVEQCSSSDAFEFASSNDIHTNRSSSIAIRSFFDAFSSVEGSGATRSRVIAALLSNMEMRSSLATGWDSSDKIMESHCFRHSTAFW